MTGQLGHNYRYVRFAELFLYLPSILKSSSRHYDRPECKILSSEAASPLKRVNYFYIKHPAPWTLYWQLTNTSISCGFCGYSI